MTSDTTPSTVTQGRRTAGMQPRRRGPVSTTQEIDKHVRDCRASPLVGWGLLAGGALFFVGGSMHPKEDPPDVTVLEHLRIMFENPAWYPSHGVLLVGMVLLAVSLIALVRGGTLARVRSAHVAGAIAAVAAVLGSLDMLLHLVAASEADKIAAHGSTPITNVHVALATLTVPFFGCSVAALAVVGAWSGTLGSRVIAVIGAVGGVGYGLAGGTVLFTDRLDFLFPFASGIGVWAFAAGIGLLIRRRATRPGDQRPMTAPEKALVS